MKTSKVASYPLVYGLARALVDASCIVLLLGGIDVRGELLTYIIIYNLLAFGLQLPLGWIVDSIHQPVLAGVLGLVILSVAIMLFIHPMEAIILAGIGNALFHVFPQYQYRFVKYNPICTNAASRSRRSPSCTFTST